MIKVVEAFDHEQGSRSAHYGPKAFARRLPPGRDPPIHGSGRHSADNTAAESFFAALKREILPDRRGRPTERAARLAVFRQHGFYNHRRRHSTIAYLAPVAFEQGSTTLAIAA
ncbi:integrase core domain-containing protein [Streptomyces sp. NPDC001617]